MLITVNDERVEIREGTTVAELIGTLGFPDKGIAVAVDWTVLPRSAVSYTHLTLPTTLHECRSRWSPYH